MEWLQVMESLASDVLDASVGDGTPTVDADCDTASGTLAAGFAADGYLHIPAFAEAGEVEFIRNRLEQLWASQVGFNQGYQFDLVGDDDENKAMAFPQIIHPSTFAPELLKTNFFLKAQALAKELLGPKAKFSSDHALLKKPLIGPETPWHQDQGFRDPAFRYDEVSVWLALQPTDPENGCMKFMRGSHRWGRLPHRPLGGNEKVHAIECTGTFNADEAILCPLPTGGCTVHGGLTLHAAGPNRSTRPRAAWVLIFELPPRPNDLAGVGGGVSHVSARAQREKRWQRRGGALVILRRYISRLDLRDPQEIMILMRRIASGGIKMIAGRGRKS